MNLNQDDLKLLVEQITDFDYFSKNGYNLWIFFKVQEWSSFFDMLNGSTYPYLVKDFWAWAEVFDESAAREELELLVNRDNSLKGKTKKEARLKEFEEMEIRSAVMGVDMVITQNKIAKLLRAPNSSKYVVGTKYHSPEADAIKQYLFEEYGNFYSSDFGKVGNMKDNFRLLFKILINCIIPREGSTNQIFWDHKHFIFYLKNEDKINMSSYIFNHICEAIKDSTKLQKKNVLYARLLPELFFQGRLIDALKSLYDNEDLEEFYGNIISASVLDNTEMKMKCEIFASDIPISVRCTTSNYLKDYPVITKIDNPELIRNFIIQSFKEGNNIRLKDIPNKPIDVHFSKKRKR
ncbi:uncharacterized protein LOC127104386 [Lathyrus oleraceus]|uniref:uncharacterized protein LOC127104386 n=1 Tax=Pisum sativum TaxID=3888 RepID=UPI0021D049E2|nr:uncharacterized protein LOC127104386 [Pisum sativum]